MRRKRGKAWCVVLCFVFILSACEGAQRPETQTHASDTKKIYKEDDFTPLPDEGIIREDGKSLSVDRIETSRDGRPAMYIPEQGMDDGEYYRQITEYVLNKKGEWERANLCEKSLTKRVTGDKTGNVWTLPYVVRGDDGELYALLIGQSEAALEAENISGVGSTYEESDGEDKLQIQYSVLHINEEKDGFTETLLRMEEETMENISVSANQLNEFHVMEDGTFFLVFEKSSVVKFDPVTGEPVGVYEKIPDNAFAQDVGFFEKELIFYSSTQKKPGILDPETMTVSAYFGDEIEEGYRQRKWIFDARTEDWSMYGFNTSGLYEIRIAGKKISMERVSRDYAFDELEDATLYDVSVGKEKEVYVLIRKKTEDSYDYQNLWDFGIVTYRCEG